MKITVNDLSEIIKYAGALKCNGKWAEDITVTNNVIFVYYSIDYGREITVKDSDNISYFDNGTYSCINIEEESSQKTLTGDLNIEILLSRSRKKLVNQYLNKLRNKNG